MLRGIDPLDGALIRALRQAYRFFRGGNARVRGGQHRFKFRCFRLKPFHFRFQRRAARVVRFRRAVDGALVREERQQALLQRVFLIVPDKLQLHYMESILM